MLFRQTVFALALAGAAIPAAFASNGSAPMRGEQGFETHAMQSTWSRADVQRELADFRKNPMTAEGGMFTQGETGSVFRSTAMTSRAASWFTATTSPTTRHGQRGS